MANGTKRKKDKGLIQQARSIINERLGGFNRRELTQARQRSTVARPFTGAPGQRSRRRALIGKSTTAPRPIIKPVVTPTTQPADDNGQTLPNNPFLPSPIKEKLKKNQT